MWAFVGVFLALSSTPATAVPGATSSMGDMMARTPIQVAPDTSSSDAAGEIIKGLAHIPAPGAVLGDRIDPVGPGEDSCDRDEEDTCPEDWVDVGAVKGGSTSYCAAGTRYFGPCSDEPQAFADMSSSAKKRWSKACQAFFPCKSCKRDYHEICPKTWTQLGSEQKCKPDAADYSGPCRGEVNFDGYNAAMLEAFSETCSAYWECLPLGASSFAAAAPRAQGTKHAAITRVQ